MLDQSFDQVKQQQERKAVEAYSSGLTFEKAKKRKKKQKKVENDYLGDFFRTFRGKRKPN